MRQHLLATPALLAIAIGCAPASAQTPADQPLRSTPVLTQPVADPDLEGAVVTTTHLELVPGALLTNPHRHPGDLFGYVLEGAILTGLGNGIPTRYEAGQMFYEPRGILHTHFQNASETTPARVLVVLLTKPEG